MNNKQGANTNYKHHKGESSSTRPRQMTQTTGNQKEARSELNEQTNLATRNSQLATQYISSQGVVFQDVLLEKRYKWLARIIVCFILSIVIHMCVAYHIHDKVIELVLNLHNTHQGQDEIYSETVEMPLEHLAISGYADSVLDSPQIHDAYDEVIPLSTAQEQNKIESVEQPDAELSEKPIEHDFQTPDAPELSDSDNLESVTVKEAEAPEDKFEPVPDTTFKPEFETHRNTEKVPLPEMEAPAPYMQKELPRNQSGSLGRSTQIEAVSAGVVLEAGVSDLLTPTDRRINIPEESTFQTTVSINMSDDLDTGTIVAPTIARPDLARRSFDLGSEVKSSQLATAASVAPKSQTTKPVIDGNRNQPSVQVSMVTSNNKSVAEEYSKSLDVGEMTTPKLARQSVDDAKLGPVPQVAMHSLKFDSLDDEGFLGPRPTIPSRNISGPTEAYKQRDPSVRKEMITQYGGDAKINQTIENGVKYISKTQWPDGRWSFHIQPSTLNDNENLIQNGNMQCDTAATALALLSMLGAGYSHQDGLYKDEIRKGLNYLIQHQQTVPVKGKNGKKGAAGALYNADTDTDINARAYAHAMATTALCEAYGLTQDPELLASAQAAARYVIATQNQELGGWRYETEGEEGQPHRESDTSSVGWQVMALRSAMLAGVLSPEEIAPSLARVQKWLKEASPNEDGLYIYCPYNGVESRYRNWKNVTPSMTAEGMFVQWCISPKQKQPTTGVNYLLQKLPGSKGVAEYDRDSYYWYYGTALMFIEGGNAWKQWQSHIMPLLRDSQLPGDHPMGGSWDVKIPQVDKWSHLGGKHYLTTMNLMILEVYIRHLSFYQTNIQ